MGGRGPVGPKTVRAAKLASGKAAEGMGVRHMGTGRAGLWDRVGDYFSGIGENDDLKEYTEAKRRLIEVQDEINRMGPGMERAKRNGPFKKMPGFRVRDPWEKGRPGELIRERKALRCRISQLEASETIKLHGSHMRSGPDPCDD